MPHSVIVCCLSACHASSWYRCCDVTGHVVCVWACPGWTCGVRGHRSNWPLAGCTLVRRLRTTCARRANRIRTSDTSSWSSH